MRKRYFLFGKKYGLIAKLITPKLCGLKNLTRNMKP